MSISKHAIHAAFTAALLFSAQGALAQGKPLQGRPQPPAEKAPDASVNAPKGQQPSVENFHAQCIGCHGIPGYKTAYPEVYHVPKIAGQSPAYIVAALKAYKSGDRSHPSMRGIAASLSEEQMQKLAEYYGAPAK
jgi:cytochrome c553